MSRVELPPSYVATPIEPEPLPAPQLPSHAHAAAGPDAEENALRNDDCKAAVLAVVDPSDGHVTERIDAGLDGCDRAYPLGGAPPEVQARLRAALEGWLSRNR